MEMSAWIPVRASPLLAPSIYFFCPSPQASTAEICALRLCSLTPRVYPQRPPAVPKHLESRSYGLTNHTNLRRPTVAKTRTRSPDSGTQFNGFSHPSILTCIHPYLHAYMHACIPYKSVDRRRR